MPVNEPIIIADRLTKRFGDFTAVDNISFEVYQGEIFGFLGANGAGKTTAMKMLCGLSRPSAGKAVIAGHDAAADSEGVKRSIGYMSQRFSLYSSLTVGENLELFGSVYGMTAEEFARRRDLLCGELGLDGKLGAMAGSLPPGWRQKLAFAAATIHNPRVLFLDEPTGGVDPVGRRGFWELICKAASEGMTVFVTTHYLDEAEYCDRVSIMVDGKIEALDTPAALKSSLGVSTMDEVFRRVAASASRADN